MGNEFGKEEESSAGIDATPVPEKKRKRIRAKLTRRSSKKVIIESENSQPSESNENEETSKLLFILLQIVSL